MVYTVKQLSDLAGVSKRTLHYYDEIALLRPSSVGANGYRYYDDEAVYRLQQILFFREMGLSLGEIRAILDSPAFDLLDALQAHRAALHDRVRRLHDLIHTVDHTIASLMGEVEMSKEQLFAGFSEEEEKRYAEEARQLYGAREVDESYKRWNRYTAEEKDRIKAEGGAIYTDLAALTAIGPDSPEVQAVIARWHQHLRHFYEPGVARLRGLGRLYVDSPDFANRFRALHPDLPEFMREAITIYCDALEANAEG
jgi:DNA-binding transcriptional MerR regulator